MQEPQPVRKPPANESSSLTPITLPALPDTATGRGSIGDHEARARWFLPWQGVTISRHPHPLGPTGAHPESSGTEASESIGRRAILRRILGGLSGRHASVPMYLPRHKSEIKGPWGKEMSNIPHANAIAYSTDAVGTDTLDQLDGTDAYNEWLFERVASAVGSRVLELGTGTGTMTRFLLDRDLLVGIDVVDRFVTDLQARFGNHSGAIFLRHDISKSADGLERYSFDSAVSFNVLEHIKDDEAALRNVHRVLSPGGTLGLVVPAHPFLRGRFDDLIGHRRRYTVREMEEKLRRAGFTVERAVYSNPVGALGWLVHIKLLGRPRLGGVRLFDAMVPLMARAERVVRPPFGLSVVAIARKVVH
jgi:SAM-dependent methyltransferase